MKNILYIRPDESSKSGIRKYSDVFMSAVSKYALNEFCLTDLNEHLVGCDSKKDIVNRIDSLLRNGFFNDFDIILAEIGLSEDREYFIYQLIKRKAQQLDCYVVLHDAPKTIVNHISALKSVQDNFLVRVFRKTFNETVGRLLDNAFLKSNNKKIIVFSRDAKKILHKKGIEANFLPLMSFYEISEKNQIMQYKAGDEIILGFCGFIAAHKGLDILIDASIELLQKGVPLKVVIGGEPLTKKDRNYLDEQVDKINKAGFYERIKFLGYIDDEAMPNFFQSIHLLVLPYRSIGTSSSSGPLKWARSFYLPVLLSRSNVFKDESEAESIFFNESSSHDLFYKVESLYNGVLIIDYDHLKTTTNTYSQPVVIEGLKCIIQ